MKKLLLFVVLLAALSGATLPARAAPYDTKRLDQIPDFTQTDPALSLPNGGRMYCVPVATANLLVWLAEHRGFKQLLPVRGLSTTEKVATVARTLGSPSYMSTAPKGGTSHHKFLKGLSAYIAKSGYRGDIRYRGRWQVPSQFVDRQQAPDIRWIKDRFDDGAAVWLSIGFYEEGKTGRELKRLGGHFVTVVGHGVNARGNPERDVLILHDSDDGGSRSIQRHYLKLEELRTGWFVNRSGNRAGDARNHMIVSQGINLRRGIKAVVDAAIALNL